MANQEESWHEDGISARREKTRKNQYTCAFRRDIAGIDFVLEHTCVEFWKGHFKDISLKNASSLNLKLELEIF